MNWDAIGAVGEILGAVGVIITLAYLAVQVRQNSIQLERGIEATRIAADDAVARGFDGWRELLISDESVSSIYLRGMEDVDTLDASGRLRFNLLLSTFTWTAWQLWRAESHVGASNAEVLRHLLRHPGGRRWYLENRAFMPTDFRTAVDRVLENLELGGVPFLERSDASSMFGGALHASAESRHSPPAVPTKDR